MHEKARQDYHGIGWAALEIIYAEFDDEPAGMSYLLPRPSASKATRDGDGFIDEQIAGHGYVQKRNGQTRFSPRRAIGRTRTSTITPTRGMSTGRRARSTNPIETMRNEGAKPANELLFIPNPHPNTLYYGPPTWISEIQTMVADQEARRFNRERLENNLILTTSSSSRAANSPRSPAKRFGSISRGSATAMVRGR